MDYKLGQVGAAKWRTAGQMKEGCWKLFPSFDVILYFWVFQVSIHSVWLGNNITPLREEEWGEDEEDEGDAPAPTSPPLSPINSRYFQVDLYTILMKKQM